MTRDPNSYIAASAEHLAETLTKKNSDYAPTGEFSNFERAAEAASITPLQLITAQIAIKLTRIESIFGKDLIVENESLRDSFLDLAGYAAIGHAWLSYVEEDADTEPDYKDLYASLDAVPAVITDRETIRNTFDDQCFHSWVQVGNDVSECDHCGEQRHG